MTPSFRCPACAALPDVDGGAVRCREGHEYSAISLALATNRNTVTALWTAIRALEDDAAGLEYLAAQNPQSQAAARQREAAEARDAAQRLREHVAGAQRRVDALKRSVGPPPV